MAAMQEGDEANKPINIVFSGGGAKGAGYPAVLFALNAAGLLGRIKEVAGASAGSLLTVLFAAGIDCKDLLNLLEINDLSSFQGKRIGKFCGFNKPHSGINGIFSYNAEPLLRFLQKTIYSSIHHRLLGHCKENPLPYTQKLSQENIMLAREDSRFEMLYQKIATVTPFQSICITFEDLAILGQHFPQVFKQPVIVATELQTGDIILLNNARTPNVELALAAKASAALPGYFAPVMLEIDGLQKTLLDGGIHANTPAQFFTEKNQTIIYAFESHKQKEGMFNALYGPRWSEILPNLILEETYIKNLLQITPIPWTHLHSYLLSLIDRAFHKHSDNKLRHLIKIKAALNTFIKTYSKDISFREIFHQCHPMEKLQLLSERIHSAIQPQLVQLSFTNTLIMGIACRLGDFSPSYLIQNKFNETAHWIYKSYSHNTTLLTTPAGIDTRNFVGANKLLHVMFACNFLDSLDYLINYNITGDHITVSLENIYKNILITFLEASKTIAKQGTLGKALKALTEDMNSTHPNYPALYQFYLKDHLHNQPRDKFSTLLARIVTTLMRGQYDQKHPLGPLQGHIERKQQNYVVPQCTFFSKERLHAKDKEVNELSTMINKNT